MEDVWNDIVAWFAGDRLRVVAQALATLAIGLLAARLLSAGAARLLTLRGLKNTLLARRITFYAIVALSLVAALQVLGVNLGLLLGAAGILTVAIGFAAQTSASNIISGLFLISERPFAIGDAIEVEGVIGEVVAIDALSVKLRTFDNRFVRVPNEQLLKSRITNLSHYPIRRVDVSVGVAYEEDLAHARAVLLRVAENLPLAFDEPKPLVLVVGFGESSVDLQLQVWATSANFLEVGTRLHMDVKAAFDAEGIEIPYPHRVVVAGGAAAEVPRERAGG